MMCRTPQFHIKLPEPAGSAAAAAELPSGQRGMRHRCWSHALACWYALQAVPWPAAVMPRRHPRRPLGARVLPPRQQVGRLAAELERQHSPMQPPCTSNTLLCTCGGGGETVAVPAQDSQPTHTPSGSELTSELACQWLATPLHRLGGWAAALPHQRKGPPAGRAPLVAPPCAGSASGLAASGPAALATGQRPGRSGTRPGQSARPCAPAAASAADVAAAGRHVPEDRLRDGNDSCSALPLPFLRRPACKMEHQDAGSCCLNAAGHRAGQPNKATNTRHQRLQRGVIMVPTTSRPSPMLQRQLHRSLSSRSAPRACCRPNWADVGDGTTAPVARCAR
jgi:hypothetical protein